MAPLCAAPLLKGEREVSLDLTYADNADRALKVKAKWSPAKTAAHRRAAFITAVVFLLMLAAAFGVLNIDPIHWY